MKTSKCLTLLFVVSLLVVFTINTGAWYSTNKTSFALSGVYDDIDTTEDADNAHSAYSSMNLSYTKKITAPTISNVQGAHANGIKYLNSGIVFMSGHGNSSLMSFKKSGSDIFYITNSTVNNNNSIGIGNYINSSNALIIFGGCQTASGTSNISSYAVSKGARTSIGWTDSINSGSHTNWLKRFNNKIKDKTTTVSEAKKSADGHIYVDSRVKTGKIYGNGNYNPWYFMNAGNKSLSIESLGQNCFENNSYSAYTINTNSKNDILEESKRYIILNIDNNFNEKDFKLEVNGDSTKYYDYILYIDNVRTNYGYTIAEEPNGTTIIYDNMKNKTIDNLEKSISILKSKSLQNSITESSYLFAKVYIDFPDSKISSYLDTIYYEETENKLYNVKIFDIELPDETFTSQMYMNEV